MRCLEAHFVLLPSFLDFQIPATNGWHERYWLLQACSNIPGKQAHNCRNVFICEGKWRTSCTYIFPLVTTWSLRQRSTWISPEGLQQDRQGHYPCFFEEDCRRWTGWNLQCSCKAWWYPLPPRHLDSRGRWWWHHQSAAEWKRLRQSWIERVWCVWHHGYRGFPSSNWRQHQSIHKYDGGEPRKYTQSHILHYLTC